MTTPPRIVLPPVPLTDGTTRLRPWRERDLPELVAACQDPEIVRWIRVPTPYRPEDGIAYLRQRRQAALAGLTAPFAIEDEAGQLAGSISLLRFAWEHARGEVGYWLAGTARGHGHATRAVGLICDWGFRALSLDRIDLLAGTGNAASQRVAERSGFTREAVLRSFMQGTFERQDMVAFGLLRRDLPPRAAD
jgi:RimJ/RimL family protein N-acetyltransferase